MRYVESLNASLHALMERNERVLLIGEDLLDPYGGAFKVSKGLSTRFPTRVMTTPISEAGIVGFGTGLAMRGFHPIVEIMFGDFLALCMDQIANGATKFHWMYNGKVDVPLVIRTPMGARRGYGATHSQSLERLFMGVTGLTIVAPSHLHDPGAQLASVVETTRSPVLFIENKKLYPMQIAEGNASRFGNFYLKMMQNVSTHTPTAALVLDPKAKPDVVLLAYGGMAPYALEAAEAVFIEDEIVVEVLIPSLIKPVPMLDILASVKRCGRVVVCEEAPKTGGWGAEVASQIAEHAFSSLTCPVLRVASEELPIAGSKPLEEEILVQTQDIVDAILQT